MIREPVVMRARELKACPSCGTTRYMETECIECCIKWLSQMTREEMAINAPMIGFECGEEHLNNVREEFKKRMKK